MKTLIGPAAEGDYYFNREYLNQKFWRILAQSHNISIAAPYLELVEEMTAKEMLSFHSKFKPLISSPSIEDMLQIVGLESAINKQLRYFSSGMKQRLKLAQAFFSDTPVLLLDEPTTNLDADGIGLYIELVRDYTDGRLLIVSSNDPMEYSFCTNVLDMKNLR